MQFAGGLRAYWQGVLGREGDANCGVAKLWNSFRNVYLFRVVLV